ncbi:insulinase family protein [uncultured Cohaesibacter sp.]|uniref:insulinase family protein n=1 Tax=uncultured Cohaesibacter sp. TaxID=1002546 RepID=UPI00292EEFA7|nr:insulinase family protein [uncultured Cohaesibacter sp.]
MLDRVFTYKHSLMIVLMVSSLLSAGPAARAAGELSEDAIPDSPPMIKQQSQSAPSAGALSQVLGATLSDLPELGSNFSSFELENGLQVVVIPDHRAPVVTHMVWYKVGAADEVPGTSGIAHFLEHLMFKGTKAHPDGEFSQIVASIGGTENAFTSHDYTAYFQQVAKQHLGLMMELEADRMANLELRDDQVKPELKVILEERAMRVDSNPSALLSEALDATLYRNHPYGIPIIGWQHEMETLDRQKALDWYNLYYTPNNAILIVAGDVSQEEVKTLAQQTYGKVARRAEPNKRVRPTEPPQRTERIISLRRPEVSQPNVRRAYLTPSDTTAKDGEAEALDLLNYILGTGTNSRFYKSLVVERKIATAAGSYYQSSGLDDTKFLIYGTPSEGHTVQEVMDGMQGEIETLIKDGVTEDDLNRAKRSLLSQTFYAQDNQAALARIVGVSLTSGVGLDALKSWPKRLAAVKPEQIIAAAQTYLQQDRSVTAYLLPPEQSVSQKAANENEAASQGQPMPKARLMPNPKDAPRVSQKVPNPKSRPQGYPKPKPDILNQKTPLAKPATK